MNLDDFIRLGLVERLPERPQLPEKIRQALEETSRLPVELVRWVASEAAGPLKTQLRQALMVNSESQDEEEAAQAMQLARLIKKRLDQLGEQI